MKRIYLGKEEKSLLKSREMIAWGQVALAVIFMLLTFTSCSNSRAIARLSKQQLSTVQLCDGTALYAKQRFSKEREDIIIQDFAQKWVSLWWTWGGTYPGRKEKDGSASADIGVSVDNGQKVPVNAWAASLMMNPQNASSFLKELSEPKNKNIPNGYFNGHFSTTVKVRYVSVPRQVKPGIWDVDLISERLIFDKRNRKQLKPIPFNKTLRIRAVTIAHSPLKENSNALERALYAMNASGLELETMFDYKP